MSVSKQTIHDILYPDHRMRTAATVALVVLVLLVFAASLVPGTSRVSQSVPDVWTNAGHLPAYWALSCCAIVVLRPLFATALPAVLLAAAGAIAMGIGIEFLQSFVDRSVSPVDVLRNTVGVLVGIVTWHLVRRSRRRILSAFRQ